MFFYTFLLHFYYFFIIYIQSLYFQLFHLNRYVLKFILIAFIFSIHKLWFILIFYLFTNTKYKLIFIKISKNSYIYSFFVVKSHIMGI